MPGDGGDGRVMDAEFFQDFEGLCVTDTDPFVAPGFGESFAVRRNGECVHGG